LSGTWFIWYCFWVSVCLGHTVFKSLVSKFYRLYHSSWYPVHWDI